MNTRNILYIIFISIFLISCKKGQKNSLEKEKLQEVFSPYLEKEISNFISYARFRDESTENKMLFNLSFFQKENTCYMKLVADYYYNKDFVEGYTKINQDLIIYNKNDSITSACLLLDRNKLTSFKDTIQGYNEIESINMKYEADVRVWKIIDSDSLNIVYDGLYFSAAIDRALDK